MDKIKQEPVSECAFEMVNECRRQTKKNKLDLTICMCCMLARIEMHTYSIAKTLHGQKKNSDTVMSIKRDSKPERKTF